MRNIKTIAFVVSHIENSPQWEWFLERLSKENYKIVFIMIGKECYLSNALKKLGIKTYILPHRNIFYYLINIFKLIHLFIKHKVDIVQTEMPIGNVVGLSAAKLIGIKKRIATAFNITWFIDYNSTKQKWIDIITYHLSTHIITKTELSKIFIEKRFNIPASKMKTIFYAYKLENHEKVTQERIQEVIKSLPIEIPTDTFIIGMVARLESWKGHQYAIEAMSEVKKKIPNAKLLIFGNGPEKKNLEALIHKLELDNTVHLCGFVKDMLAMYKAFNIHVHVPVDEMCETFGITILEGMMSKIPQILTKSGIAYYTAEHLKTCWVVPYKNSSEIATAVLELYKNKTLRDTLVENAYQLAKEKFQLENRVIEHVKLYEA